MFCFYVFINERDTIFDKNLYEKFYLEFILEIIKTFQSWFEIKFVSLDRVMKFVVGHSEKTLSNQRPDASVA